MPFVWRIQDMVKMVLVRNGNDSELYCQVDSYLRRQHLSLLMVGMSDSFNGMRRRMLLYISILASSSPSPYVMTSTYVTCYDSYVRNTLLP